MNPRRLFIASCISLIASAFSFVVRQDVLPAWGQSFTLSASQLGSIGGQAFFGMAAAMLVGAPLCDKLGMKFMLGMAFLCHLVGTIVTIATPYIASPGDSAFLTLCIATFLVGAANGFVEIGINPLAATLYPTEKTHMLNVLHAWWPGGLMLGGLISLALSYGLGIEVGGLGKDPAATQFGWQIKMAIILIPTILYGAIFLGAKLPKTERVEAGISSKEMYSQALRPLFLLWAFCMLLTASTELAPQGMQSLVLEKTAGMNGTIILVYTSLIMFILRHFAGPIAHAVSPVGMLIGSSVLSAIGLFALSYATDTITAIGAATIFGLGIVYFWPTMLGVTAERFPRGGAFLLGIMGCVGNIAISQAQPAMGSINDRVTISSMSPDIRSKVVDNKVVVGEKVKALPQAEQDLVLTAQKEGASQSFRYVTVLPLILVVLFTGIALYDKSRGGYKPEEISSAKIDQAKVSSDY